MLAERTPTRLFFEETMQDNQTPSPLPPPPYYAQPRRRTRWWIPLLIIGGVIFVFFAAIIGFVAFIGAGISGGSEPVRVKNNTVLLVDLSGGIPEYKPQMRFSFGGSSSTGPSLFDMLTAIREAKTDDNIKGIYYRAGGGAGMAKLTEIREALLDFKSSGKFVYAFIETGGKAHYYLASVADSIIMPEEGMLDFSAFGANGLFMKGMFDKLGVQWHVEQFEEYKSAAEMMSRDSWSAPAKEEIRAIIEQRQAMFVGAIAASRKLDAAVITSALHRGVFQPDSLKSLGLIDGLAREGELRARIQRRIDPSDTTDHPKLRTISVAQYVSSEDFGTSNTSVDDGHTIGIVYASGAIHQGKNDDPFSADDIYAKNLISELRRARDDDDVDIIVLRVDSPGGSAIGSDEIWAEIREIRKTKPVYASMSDVAASGGYYIAMACDTIIAHSSTITGSIGVIMSIPNLSGTLGKIGVTADTISLGSSANFMNPTMPFSDEAKAALHNYGDGIYRRFVSKVAESRKMTFDEARAVAKGRIWSGEAAKNARLVDVNGGLLESIRVAKARIGADPDKKVRIKKFPEDIDNIGALLKMFGLADEDDDRGEASVTAAHVIARLVPDASAAESLWKSLPEEERRQVRHAATMLDLSLRERTLTVLPSIPF